jgi:glycerol-3-phosphate dehydrogenase subunit B
MTDGGRRETVVVGIGVAGLVAALRLAQAGRRPLVVAKGVGSTHLAGATVDVLGYAAVNGSGDGGGPVARPGEVLAEFVAAHPDHPYARVGPVAVTESLSWFREVAPEGYQGGLDTNWLLPTAVGAAKPAALAPAGMVGGDLRAGGRFALVGIRQLKDFHAPLAAANLSTRAGVAARAVEVDLGPGEADLTPLALARNFDDPAFRALVANRLEGLVDPAEAVGFPAVLGLAGAAAAREDLETRLGCRVFEIPTLPPSVPGIRLFNGLRGALVAAGGWVVVGAEVGGGEVAGGRLRELWVQTPGRRRTIAVDAVVLATGGLASGAIAMDSYGQLRETVLGLPLAGGPGPGEPGFAPEYLGHHPVHRSGVAVDERLRPVDGDGRVVAANLHAAGAVLAGAEPWREKSGEGISVATGYRAAAAVLEEGGA